MRVLNQLAKPAWGSSAAGLALLVSSACCIGPLAIILSYVGLSVGTMVAVEQVVGPFRPLVLTGTVILLGFGFYGAYRPLEACGPDEACARPQNRRKHRLALWTATGLFVVLLYFTYVHPNLDLWFGIYL